MRAHRIVVGIGAAFGLVAAMGTAASASCSWDSARIAFTKTDYETGETGLYTARPDGTKQRLVRKGNASFPAWSPDRRKLLYDFTDGNGDQQLATVRPDGSGYRQLTRLPGITETGDYSPDGRTIIFARSPLRPDDPGFHTSLWVMRADGSKARPLRPGATTFDVEPEYSPDGRHVIFNVDYEQDYWDPRNGIFTVRATGGPMRQLLPPEKHGLQGFKPDYSPNGRHIVFACVDLRLEQSDDLCLMDSNGRNVRRLTDTPTIGENHVVWS